MSDDRSYRCPVCRAAQPLRDTCRRCQADLRLAVRARRRLAYVRRKLAEAAGSGDQQHAKLLAAELRWLAPR